MFLPIVQMFRCLFVIKRKNLLRKIPLFPKTLNFNRMTTRSQKKKAVAELVSGEFEASVAENSQSEILIAGPSKTLRVEPENLDAR